MPNLTLAPEDDDSDSPRGREVGPSPQDQGIDLNQWTEMQDLRVRFDPHKVGFGLLPWPGVDPALKDNAAIAMKFLIDGKDHRNREEKK
jgi:hypothetical protein